MKNFEIIRDTDGQVPQFWENKLLKFSDTTTTTINNSTPTRYLIAENLPGEVIFRLTYYPTGWGSYGSATWVKKKDNIDDMIYKYVDLNPEFITLRNGNVLFMTGARLYDDDFVIQFEVFRYS